MNKYYLLTFNDDYGDEHNVPALECMTEEEYNTWLSTPVGILNENYSIQKEKYDNAIRESKEVQEELKSLNWWSSSVDLKSLSKELQDKYQKLSKKSYVSYRDCPKKLKQCFLWASLGNSGEYFNEGYMNHIIMKDFVDDKTVSVVEVDENFYETFKKVNLNNLSLCNIFRTEELIENY